MSLVAFGGYEYCFSQVRNSIEPRISLSPALSNFQANNKSVKYLKLKAVKNLKVDTSRVVKLLGEVNAESALRVASELGKLNRSSDQPITLIINSPGGDVIAGGQIVNAIEASRSPINTVCVEMCASMAALIHQYGTKRMVFSHAILMFHGAAGVAIGDVDRMDSMISMFKRYVSRFEANVALRSGMTLEEYRARAGGPNIWIDGQDAYQEKLADELVYIQSDTLDSILAETPDQATIKRKSKLHKELGKALFQIFKFAESYTKSVFGIEDTPNLTLGGS